LAFAPSVADAALAQRKHAQARKHQARRGQLQQYSVAAQQMDDLLQDGFALSRHVYGNALSEGARFYCKSIVWT